MLIVPGAAGEIGVLARHAPLVALLKAGSTRVHVKRGTDVREFATGPGFFKVEQDRALALVDDAVDVDEIDAARAQAQLEAAQAELAKIEAGESDADRWQLEQRIKHAENQLAVATGGDAGDFRPRTSRTGTDPAGLCRGDGQPARPGVSRRPRVEEAVEDVDDEVREDDDHREHHRDPHRHGVVAAGDRDHEIAADPGDPEDELDDERAGDQEAEQRARRR